MIRHARTSLSWWVSRANGESFCPVIGVKEQSDDPPATAVLTKQTTAGLKRMGAAAAAQDSLQHKVVIDQT